MISGVVLLRFFRFSQWISILCNFYAFKSNLSRGPSFWVRNGHFTLKHLYFGQCQRTALYFKLSYHLYQQIIITYMLIFSFSGTIVFSFYNIVINIDEVLFWLPWFTLWVNGRYNFIPNNHNTRLYFFFILQFLWIVLTWGIFTNGD